MINMVMSAWLLVEVVVSLRLGERDVVPAETAELARAIFPSGCMAMRVRDVLGPIFTDAEFSSLFSSRGRPALSPGLLALVSVLQFAEGLTDRQAAHAVRTRIDWKYALGLSLADRGFDYSVLSEFRARLVAGGLEQRVLDAVLDASAQAGLLKPGGRQRTDATHVLAVVRDLNRLQFVTETLRAALNALAAAAPDWLAGNLQVEWFDRYCALQRTPGFPPDGPREPRMPIKSAPTDYSSCVLSPPRTRRRAAAASRGGVIAADLGSAVPDH